MRTYVLTGADLLTDLPFRCLKERKEKTMKQCVWVLFKIWSRIVKFQLFPARLRLHFCRERWPSKRNANFVLDSWHNLFYVSDLIVSTCIQINLVQIMMRTDLTLLIQPDKTQRVSPINISRFEICQNCEKKVLAAPASTIHIGRSRFTHNAMRSRRGRDTSSSSS